jgi:ESCRT-I complex subunit VPS37
MRLTQWTQRHRPSFLHLRLRHSLTAQDDLSEKIASAFIEGRAMPSGNGNGVGSAPSSLMGSRVDSPAPGAVGDGTATPTNGDRVCDEISRFFNSPPDPSHPLSSFTPPWRVTPNLCSRVMLICLVVSADNPQQSQNKAIDDFISDFKAARKTYHKRAIWAERWSRGEVAWRDD